MSNECSDDIPTALTYLQQDNFDSALAVMDRLPVEFELGAKEISEKDRTKQYIGIVQGYRMDGRTKAELNADEQNALRNLRDGYYDRPAEWAQNILCFGYDICRPTLTGGDQRAQPRLVPPWQRPKPLLQHSWTCTPTLRPAG